MEVLVKFLRFVATLVLIAHVIKMESDVSISNTFDLVTSSMNYNMARSECQSRGFDGLAIISSPEEFNYAVSLTETARKTLGLWVALSYNANLDKLMWHDGTEVASDMPWLKDQPKLSTAAPCGRIHISGVLGMLACHIKRFAVCGYHKRRFIDGNGSRSNSTMPTDIQNVLSQHGAKSYLQCVVLCTRQYTCRAAWFGLTSNRCILIGPGGFKAGSNSDSSHMFVRVNYVT